VTSAIATLTVTALPPTIVQHPSSLAVTPGQTAGFTVVAAGESPLSYQWRFNGADDRDRLYAGCSAGG
jgi:hypothetical protein